jgi:UDP-glucose 4-epimerase
VYATLHDVPGVYNVAGEGTMPWSEVCAILGKRRVPMPPFLTGLAVEPLRLARLVDLPPEVLALLRYGRGVDTSRYREAGFGYEYTTAGAVDAFARGLRLQTTVGRPEYRYERDVENFFRHSPAVVRDGS